MTVRIVMMVLTVAALAAVTPPQAALAHAAYEASTPSAGAVVVEAPRRVEIVFSQDLFRRAGANTILVLDSSGNAVHEGVAQISDSDRRRLSVDLQHRLSPGEFEVRWTTLSATDGDPANGSFTFTVDPFAVATATPPAIGVAQPTSAPARPSVAGTGTSADSGTDLPLWVALAALGVAASGILVVWALRPFPGESR